MTEPGIKPDPTEHERGLALLAEVFSSRVRAVVLGWLVPRMDTPFSLTELSREVDVPISSLQHECYKLERLGVLQGRREGVSRRYRLQHEHQLVRPLVALVIASLGLEAVLTASLSDAGTIGYAVLAGPSRPGEDVLLAIDGDADLATLERAHQRVCLVLGMDPARIELAYFRTGEHPLDASHPLTIRLAGRPLQAIAGTWPRLLSRNEPEERAMTQPPWMLDELAHAGHEHLDDTYVPGYDAKAQTDPNDDLRPILDRGFGPGQTLVDLGAGTGTFALAASKVFDRVIATDVSPVMLGVLERAMAAQGIDNLLAVQSGFLSYAHEGPPVDVVYSRHALHHLPDFWKVVALNRIANLLRPGGMLYIRDLVYGFEPQEIEARIDAWTSRGAPGPAVGWTAEELQEHVREEHTTFSWLLEVMLERCGFTILQKPEPGGIYATYICEKR